jgi:hypothetical protein
LRQSVKQRLISEYRRTASTMRTSPSIQLKN